MIIFSSAFIQCILHLFIHGIVGGFKENFPARFAFAVVHNGDSIFAKLDAA